MIFLNQLLCLYKQITTGALINDLFNEFNMFWVYLDGDSSVSGCVFRNPWELTPPAPPHTVHERRGTASLTYSKCILCFHKELFWSGDFPSVNSCVWNMYASPPWPSWGLYVACADRPVEGQGLSGVNGSHSRGSDLGLQPCYNSTQHIHIKCCRMESEKVKLDLLQQQRGQR